MSGYGVNKLVGWGPMHVWRGPTEMLEDTGEETSATAGQRLA